ncbi:armadillo-type fold domain containing protein [Rhodotorula toruloides]|uniref:Armadillo-type fold domain containing protein n=1 Tax=Rhodotorula toruloides TaxID=5286 RepID=A0A511K7G4_RHOTO|nr:armadillo-type fold domain containing protein [Rhodotorula toruloides]
MGKGKSTNARKPQASSSGSGGSGTLRSLRHAASSTSSLKPTPKVRSTASLTVAERIAKKAEKPLVKGRSFRFVAPSDRIAKMKVDLEGVRDRREQLEGEDDAQEDDMHTLFGHALQQSQLIDLSLPFGRFSRKVDRWSRSLPLVVHYREEIVEAVCEVLSSGSKDVELCGETILDLLPPLITDLSHLLLPSLPLLLTTLIRLTTPSPFHASNPRILQRTYDVLGALFRDLARDVLGAEGKEGGVTEVWEVVRRGLGAPARSEDGEEEGEDVAMQDEAETKADGADLDAESSADEEEEEAEEETEPVASTSAQPLDMPAPAGTKLHTSLPANFRTTPQTRRLLGNAFAFFVRKAKPTSADEAGSLDPLLALMVADVAQVEGADGGERANRGRGAKGRRKGKGKGRGQEEGSSNVFAEGLTWVIIESCCAANHFFHSRTPLILRSLFSVILSLPSLADVSLPREIVSHALVTLSQHAEKVEALEPVGEAAIKTLEAELKMAIVGGEVAWERLLVTLQSVTSFIGVKAGARLPASLKPRLFASLAPLSRLLAHLPPPPSAFLHHSNAYLSTVLPLAALSDVLSSPVRSTFDALFSADRDASVFASACALATVLDGVEWPLWDTALGASVLTATASEVSSPASNGKSRTEGSPFDEVIASKKENSLVLLARLAESGRLWALVEKGGAQVGAWEKSVGSLAEQAIKDWKEAFDADMNVDEAETHELLDVLAIVPCISSRRNDLLNLLTDLATTVATTPATEARVAYLSSAASPALVLGSTLTAFEATSSRLKSPSPALQTLAASVESIVAHFAWHRRVMHGLSALSLARLASDRSPEARKVIYDAILPNLLSEDSILRRSSLEIAQTLYPQNEAPVAADLIAKCIEVEDMPLTVQGAREKSMKVRKLGIVANSQLGKEGSTEELEPVLEIVLRYLTAMLKVNFKPIWPEAISAIALLSSRFPDAVWSICSRQLLAAATRGSDLYVARRPEWALHAASSQGSGELELVFEEQALRDWHLEDRRMRVQKDEARFEGGVVAVASREEGLVSLQMTPERLVTHSYEAQLLALFCQIPDLAQRHSRDFVDVFLGCFQRDDVIPDKADEMPLYFNPDETAKDRKARLLAWLGLFAKFSNPKALYRAADLDAQFRTLLAFPDAEIQKLALDCILRWKMPAVTANADRLKNLLEPTKLRDELLQFVSTTDAGGLEPAHRADVVPLFIRITYGLMTSRLGRASASSGQGRAGRRAAILGALRTCTANELDTLVDLLLGPLRKLLVTPPSEPFRFAEQAPNVPGKRQLGFLGLLADVVKHLGKDIVGRWPDLMGVVLNLLHFTQKGLEEDARAGEKDVVEFKEDEEDADEREDEDDMMQLAPLRHIRQTALKRWTDFFRLEVEFDYRPYVSAAFPSIISPRLPTLAAENAQAPSALLELFVAWSKRRDQLRFLVDYDSSLLPSLYHVLTVRNVKPTVILRVFDLVASIVEFAQENGGKADEIGQQVIQPGVDALLVQLGGLLAVTSSTLDAKGEVAQRQIALLCSLAPYVHSEEQSTHFLALATPLLRKTNKTVPEKVKTDLLRIVTALYPIARPQPGSQLYDKCCEVVASLFASSRTRNARLQLVAALNSIASVDESYAQVAQLVDDLNSYSVKRSEEPDFDRRLAAFSRLNEDLYRTLTTADWTAVIQNMLFFVQDADELSIRSNASYAMRRFIEVVDTGIDESLRVLFIRTFLPGLRKVLRSKVELIRAEVLAVLGHAVEKVEGVPELAQLKVLLVGGDQEANFFNNVLHIQNHRRTRALRRLADAVEAGGISSKTIADLFLPLLDHFVLGSDEKKDPDLVNETVQCLARLAKHLAWSAYSKLALHYLKLAKVGGASQKACVRTLVGVLKSFHFDLEGEAKALESTTGRLVPQLMSYLEKREESDQEIRIPIAEGIAAVIQHIPGESKHVQETGLLMALAQSLRSRDQHVRDLIRVTLANIATAQRGDILGRIVKELRKALMRGPQLHVSAFTVHALLVRLVDSPENVDFDSALDEVVPVLEDDVFGNPSKDRTSQEFRAKTKFREVRSFKSLDSFQLLARVVSPGKIASLLAPLRGILSTTDSAKAVKDVEEVFKALAIGLTANTQLDAVATLDLCHSLISQNAAFLKAVKVVRKHGKAAPDYHVQFERERDETRDYYAKNAYRFVSFGLELFNAAFRKSVFDLDSPDVLSRLEPLVSLVGNSLYSDDPVVLARSMRATASLIRCPRSSTEKAAPVLVKQMLSVIERAGSTESELAQSALRTLSNVLRDCKAATLSEKQLTSLLELIGPDLEEADRQATLFQVLRAVMARKFVAPEIYDLMNKVAEMLVTNQSSNVREICRAIYLQFLLDYPQGRGRLKESLTFLAKNLSYAYESGRLSVLELVSAILNKFATQLIQDSAELFFVALVMVVANDDSTKCREMGAELLKLLFSRLEKDTRDVLLTMLHSWVGKKTQPQLARTAIQVFGIAVDAMGDDGRSAAHAVVDVLLDVLTDSEDRLEEAETQGGEALDLEAAWQLPYQALQATAHVYKAFPDLVSPDAQTVRPLWRAVRSHLLYPHLWVRTSAARLLGSLYAASQDALSRDDLPERHPLTTLNLFDAAQKACLQLKSPLLDDSLAMQIVKNLFFAARCFAARDSRFADAHEEDGDEDEHEDGDATEEQQRADPLKWLFTRLSYQARQAHMLRPSVHDTDAGQWSRQPASILRWFAAMISSLDAAALQRFLMQMAVPIFRVSEDTVLNDPQMVELQTLSREVQELLQQKIGTTAYAQVHNQIRQRAAARRNERKQATALKAINDPAEDAKRKAKRAEQKKTQKKRKAAAMASQKERYGVGAKRRRE